VLPISAAVSQDDEDEVVDELQEVDETEHDASGSGDEEDSMDTSPDEMLDPPSSDLPCRRIASSSFLCFHCVFMQFCVCFTPATGDVN
jgi:hypothetical protein